MSEINAGVVVVTKFVSAGSAVFGGYIDYINRSNAVRNKAIDKYSIPALNQDIKSYNEYMGYMEDSKKTTDLFTAEKNHLSDTEKNKLKEVFQQAQDNDSLMWQTVISFDNKWLAENGLFDTTTKILQENKLKDYARGAINEILKKEGMNNNSLWSAAIHYNTDNIHIHIATVQPVPQREMKMLKTIQFDSEWITKKNILNEDIFKEIEVDKEIKAHKAPKKNGAYVQILHRLQDEIKTDTGRSCALGDYIKINADYSIDISYNGDNSDIPSMAHLIKENYTQKGKFKQSSIEAGKSFIVNKIIQQSRNNDKIQLLVRDTLIKNMRDTPLDQSPDLQQLYGFLLNRLPHDKRLWQYNRNSIAKLRRDIDKFTTAWLQKNHPEDFKELNRLLAAEQALYQTAYGGETNEYQKNQIEDLYARLGNIILKNLKTLSNSEFIPDNISDLQIEKIIDSENDKIYYEADSANEADNAHYTFFADKTDFSKKYKLAKKYLYGAKDFPANRDKAFTLMSEEAKAGNILAIYDLGYMYSKGLGCQADSEQSDLLYSTAFQGFNNELHSAKTPGAERYLLYRIAKMQYSGFGVEKDLNIAFSNFQKSYDVSIDGKDEGYAYAQFYLARFYETGEENVIDVDLEKAFAYFKDVTEKTTIPHATYKVGYMLEHGIGTEIDAQQANAYYAKAIQQFEKASEERPDDFIQYRLGKMYLDGKGTEVNTQKALHYLELSVNAGNDMAAYTLAKFYLDNENFSPEKIEKAMKLLHLSADKNNVMAQYQLGVIYAKTDEEKAIHYLTLAAAQKNHFADYQLGKIYQKSGDISKAIEAFEKAEKHDNYFAAYKLGVIFAKQQKIFDYNKAENYLLKAAGHDFSSAEYQLGSLYLTNSDNQKSVLSGMDYLTQAADMNNEYAQYRLGKIFYYGNKFVPADFEKSLNYFKAAAAQGNQYAQRFLKSIEERQKTSAVSQKPDTRIYPPEFTQNFERLLKALGRDYRTRENFKNQQAYTQMQYEIEKEKEER